MLNRLYPAFFLVMGLAAGAGAGWFLAPGGAAPETGDGADGTHTRIAGHEPPSEPAGAGHPETEDDPHAADTEFVRLNNQFVVPVLDRDRVAALVVMSLSIEARNGLREEIYAREPKLRDAFLQVLFDHANMGGFHGAFTESETLGLLRTALREVAQRELGPGARSVLIVDIARQDS